MRLGIAVFSNVPADLPVSRIEVRAQPALLYAAHMHMHRCFCERPSRLHDVQNAAAGPVAVSAPCRIFASSTTVCSAGEPCMHTGPMALSVGDAIPSQMSIMNLTSQPGDPADPTCRPCMCSAMAQAVLVDRTGPVTVTAEPGTAADAGVRSTETPPAIAPIKIGTPSRNSSRPTTPKGPGMPRTIRVRPLL